MDLLLFVHWIARTRWIESLRGGSGDRRRVFCPDVKALTEGRNWSGDGALGEILVVNIGHIVDAEAAFAQRGVEIFAAQLHVQNVSEMVVGFLQFAVARHVPLIILRVGDTL